MKKQLNVVIINDQAHVDGGASQVAVASALGLAKRRFPVTFFAACQKGTGYFNDSSVGLMLTDQYEILDDPNRIRAATQGLWNTKAEKLLSRTLAGMDPANTIIHIHSFTKALSSSMFRVAQERGFSVVYTLHDYFAACPNGAFFDFPAGKICERRPMSAACISHHCDARSYPQKLWRVARQFTQQARGHVANGIRHFIYVSAFSRGIIAPYLPDQAHYYHVPNPIDGEQLPPVNVAANRRYLAVGRLTQEKGTVLLAKAAQAAQLDVTFVGDGVKREEIAAIGANHHITGWLPHSEVNHYYRQARALVFPSLWYETQGLVVLEAASRGVPAIVSDGCAARDMIDDGITGLLFKHEDAADLARKMRMLEDDQLVKELGQNAYQKYWNNPSTLDHHLDCLIQVYQQILAPDDTNQPTRKSNGQLESV